MRTHSPALSDQPGTLRRQRPPAHGGPAGAVLRLQRAAGNRATRRLIQRIDDDELQELLKKKPNKQKHDAARTKYLSNFGSGGQYEDYHGAETWDYWVKEALDLDDLKRKIDDLVIAAAAAAATSASIVSSSGSVATPVVNLPSSSSSVSSLVTSTSSIAPVVTQQPQPQPQPQPKKKKKGTSVPLSTVFSSTSTTQQVVDETVPITNTQVQQLIASRPPGATRAVGAPAVSADTVYYMLTVWLPVDYTQGYPRRRRYELEIHHHPVPTSPNYLHVKIRAGTSPQNVLPLNSWLVDTARLNAGVAAWNQANPTYLSVQQF
jgi:hypothetical protein